MDPQITAAIIGALITVALGAILAAIGWAIREYRGGRGNFVKVTIVYKSQPLLPAYRPTENLKISYFSQLLENLYLTKLQVINTSNVLVEPLEIILEVTGVGNKPKFFEISALESEYKTDITAAGDDKYKIRRQFLKPNGTYKDEFIELVIASDVEIDIKATGGGSNWGVRLATAKTQVYSSYRPAMLGLVMGGISIGFSASWLIMFILHPGSTTLYRPMIAGIIVFSLAAAILITYTYFTSRRE